MSMEYCVKGDHFVDLDYADGYTLDEDGHFVCQDCRPDLYYGEDDGQPDELQEWHDYDPDC